MARKKDPILFGTFPVTNMIFHIVIAVLAGLGFFMDIAFLYAMCAFIAIKIITISCLRESRAYCNTKNSQDMHTFLQ